MLKNIFFSLVIQKIQEESRLGLLLWILSGPLWVLSNFIHVFLCLRNLLLFLDHHFCPVWRVFFSVFSYFYPFPCHFNFSPFFSVFREKLPFLHNTYSTLQNSIIDFNLQLMSNSLTIYYFILFFFFFILCCCIFTLTLSPLLGDTKVNLVSST